MWPYFVILLITFLAQIQLSKRSNRNVGFTLIFVVLFLFAALRGNGDGDYFNYLIYSKYITTFSNVLDFRFPMEIGFRLISYLVNSLGLHEQTVIAIMNLISLTCIYTFINKYSPDKALSVLLFLPLYFQYDMHAARTAVAIGISTLSFQYIYDRNLLKYVFVVFLASAFHKSAFILLPMYFIGHLKINRSFGALVLLVMFFITELVSTSTLALRLLNIIGLNSIAARFQVYMSSTRFGYAFKLYDPRFFLVIGTYLLATSVLRKTDKMHNTLINYMWVNSLLMIFFREHTAFVTRLSSFFNIYSIIVIPHIIFVYKERMEGNMAGLTKLSFVYAYLLYISALLVGAVEYKLFFCS